MSSRPVPPRSKAGKQRRATSMARAPGRVRSGGERTAAHALGDALRAARNDEVVADSLTHPLHTYPARMHPATARSLVELCFETESVTPHVLLDPFCGSGTSLVEGRAAGLDVIGSDLNPLAVRIARAKTWVIENDRRKAFRQLGLSIAADALEEGKAARRADYEQRPWRIPKSIDKEVREEEIGEWFAPHVRRELEFLAGRIDEVRESDGEMADVLAVCLSSILIKCSKRSSDTSSKVVQRKIGRGLPARWFQERVELLFEGLYDLHRAGATGTVQVIESDARKLASRIDKGSVGAIISSPPYAGTYDYVDHHRLRLAFLGWPFKAFESGEIGARRRFKGRADQAMERVYKDFRACMAAFHELLTPGGLMVLMVGDSVAGTEPVWADGVLKEVAGDAFEAVAWASQERTKLGNLEKRAFGEYPKQEHLVLLAKR